MAKDGKTLDDVTVSFVMPKDAETANPFAHLSACHQIYNVVKRCFCSGFDDEHPCIVGKGFDCEKRFCIFGMLRELAGREMHERKQLEDRIAELEKELERVRNGGAK